MKRLKILYHYKIIVFFFFIVSLIHCYVYIQKDFIKTIDSKNIKVQGKVLELTKYDDKTTLIIKNTHKYLINIYEVINVDIGDDVLIEGIVKEPSTNRTFNLFNYKLFLKTKKIDQIIVASKVTLINKNTNFIYKIKQNLIKYIDSKENKNYLYAFIIGKTNYIEEHINESFRINGISHLLAVSGSHITFIAIIVLNLLKKFNNKFKYFVCFSVLIFYLFLTDFSVSVFRSVFVFIILSLNKLFKFKLKPIYVLLFVLGIHLFINPYIIYNIGAQFSYLISFGLIMSHNINKVYKNKIILAFIISFISFLLSFPIVVNNFFEINLFSPIINLIFIPYITFIVFPLSILSLMPSFFNDLFVISLNIMEYGSLLFSNFKIFYIILSKISLIGIILYYVVIFLIIYQLHYKKIRCISLFIIMLIIHYNISFFKTSSEIVIIDVNQGDSCLIILPNNKGNILIDTGGEFNYKTKTNNNYLSNSIIIPYLKSVGIRKLNYVIFTHGDYDHMGEGLNLINKFKVEKVIFNNDKYNNLELEIIDELNKKNIKYYQNMKKINIKNNKLYFLNNKNYDNENDNSNVIYAEIDHFKLLFMGDVGKKVEENILKEYNLSDIDILKVGHHGSNTSSSKSFINQMKPKYSIISVGKNNRYGHPHKEVLNNLKNSTIYRTDKSGSISIKIKKNQLKITTSI